MESVGSRVGWGRCQLLEQAQKQKSGQRTHLLTLDKLIFVVIGQRADLLQYVQKRDASR